MFITITGMNSGTRNFAVNEVRRELVDVWTCAGYGDILKHTSAINNSIKVTKSILTGISLF